MTDLGAHLERLGLEQYLDAFVGEGFDSWSTLLDIQESDFDALNVKLGHRRKLQRAIADYRGIPYERLIGTSPLEGPVETGKGDEDIPAAPVGGTAGSTPQPETKRKYRRHPKPDENAPERPPSAYVIFSNRVREEVKGESLSFTEIAKLVGDRWQKLAPSGKEPYESQANAAKERYNIQLSAYKKTDAYKEFIQYLAEFKAKHGGQSESKRPKLEPESSGGSISAKSLETAPEMLMPSQGHVRIGSIGSISSSSYSTTIQSPAGILGPPVPVHVTPSTNTFATRFTSTSSRGGSPPSSQHSREIQRRGQISNQSSVSDESSAVRSESEALLRTAALSLGTPPSNTPPLPPITASGSVSEYGASPDAGPRLRFPPIASPQGPGGLGGQIGPPTHTLAPYGQSVYAPSGADGSWRPRPSDLRVYADTARVMQSPVSYSPGMGPGGLPLPPLISPDRLSELSPGALPRTLPLPRPSPASQQRPGFPLETRASEPLGQTPHELSHRQSPGMSSAPPTLDRSESEAANALAGLASGARPEVRKGSGPREPNR